MVKLRFVRFDINVDDPAGAGNAAFVLPKRNEFRSAEYTLESDLASRVRVAHERDGHIEVVHVPWSRVQWCKELSEQAAHNEPEPKQQRKGGKS